MAQPFEPHPSREILLNLAAARTSGETGAHGAILATGGKLPARGLVFEIENVVYDATHWRRWLAHVVSKLGVAAEYPSFYTTWDRDFLPEVYVGRREYCEAFQAFLLEVGLSWGQIDEIEAASRVWRPSLETQPRLFPKVAATLCRLTAAGVPLVVLANSIHPAEKLDMHLGELGVRNYFCSVLSSLDLEAAKPDARAFAAAQHAAGCDAAELVYLGYDGPSLAGAAAAGLRCVAINHAPGVKADAYLERFDQLIDVLDLMPGSEVRKAA